MPNVIKPSQKYTGTSTTPRTSNVVKLSSDGGRINSFSGSSSNITNDSVILSSAFEKAKKIVEAANVYSANHIKEATERMNLECAETKKFTHDEAYASGFAEGKKEGLEAGKAEGYEAGRREAMAELRENSKGILERLSGIVNSIDRARMELLAKEEDNLSELAILIAEKILSQEVEANRAVMGSIISRVVSDNQDQEWIKVNVSHDVYDELEKTFFDERIEELSKNVTICPSKDLNDADCVIEMPGYVTDASISTQLTKINSVFKSKS